MLLPLIVLNALHLEHYVLSMAFGALSTWLSDPGGNYGLRGAGEQLSQPQR
jgi:hypothetical protein